MFTHHKTLFSLMAVLLLSIAAAKSSPAPTDYNRSDTEDIETKEQRSGEETDESTELFDEKQLGSMGTQEYSKKSMDSIN
uniref:Secreted protein n=2 Tax=Magallana gigas TaxID=29159 RepID=A0A8W8JW79_MAGGI